ncbi:Uncharacterised protein [Mycobacteroides abscessus subsp. abscessus]|nr:Uncharacterised protein [Mycobacteroides abscessus subsp. abscessus]
MVTPSHFDMRPAKDRNSRCAASASAKTTSASLTEYSRTSSVSCE